MSSSANPLGDFLQAYRARLRPEDVGLVTYGTRRVPGLRREELAHLAGISPTYYTRLEQGNATNVSSSIVNALTRALRLDNDATLYLHRLAGTTHEASTHIATLRALSDDSLFEDVVSLMPTSAAIAMSRTNDVLSYNELAKKIFFPHISSSSQTNTHRLLFTDPYTQDLYSDWMGEARLAVASLRFISASYPHDADIRNLVAELSIANREFARLWNEHPVTRCTRGQKRLMLPDFGSIELNYHVLHSPLDDGQRIIVYYAPERTSASDVLRMLIK